MTEAQHDKWRKERIEYETKMSDRVMELVHKEKKLEDIKTWFEDNKHKRITWDNWKELEKILHGSEQMQSSEDTAEAEG